MQGLRSNEKGLTDTSYAALYIFWKWCCVWCSSQFRLFVTDKFTESICFPRSWLCHLYLRHVPLRFCLSPLEPPVSNILFKSASSVDLFTFKPGFKECTLYPALPTFNSRAWLDCLITVSVYSLLDCEYNYSQVYVSLWLCLCTESSAGSTPCIFRTIDTKYIMVWVSWCRSVKVSMNLVCKMLLRMIWLQVWARTVCSCKLFCCDSVLSIV